MDKYSKTFYDKYQQYFIRIPSNIKEMETFIPFITPLVGHKHFSSHEFAIIIVTTIIQIIIYGLNITYMNHLFEKQRDSGCECSKNDITTFIYWYSISKIIFLTLIISLYVSSYNKILPIYVSQIFPLVIIISAVDIVSLYPLWLYVTDEYYKKLNYDRCECSESRLKALPHFFANISVTSYTIIIISLIHALVSMIFAYLFWKLFLTKK
jgi:hypothetical protein